MKTKKIPKSLYKYFWDVDAGKISVTDKSVFIAERLLEFGNKQAIKWLINQYNERFLQQTVKLSKQLSKKSANYFSYIYDINPKDILCLQLDYQNKHKKIWPY